MVFELLDKKIQKWLKETKGFLEPTSPQLKSIPSILKGKNILLRAPTGYGKTLAVMLPIIHLIKQKNKENEGPTERGIKAVYITPLRSLNRDVFQRIVQLGASVWIDVDIRHGDTSQKERRAQLKHPPHILITTPETMQILLTSANFKKYFSHLNHVIIDEIHELFESKRGSQLSVLLERLEEISPKYQRIGLSATIGDINEIKKFLCPYQECEVLITDEKKDYEIIIEYPEPNEKDMEIADKLLISKKSASLLRRMDFYLNNCKNALIFTNTRQGAEILGSRLKKYLGNKHVIEVHHSSLSKQARIETENKFKKGEIKAIVATSSLELGIDIGSVDLVLQSMSPRQVSKLTQRIGRGGHKAGLKSKGVIFPINIEDLIESKAIVKKMEEKWLETPIPYNKPYDVLINQIIGMLISTKKEENKNYTEKKIYNIIKKSYAFKDLTEEEFKNIIDFMQEIKLIYRKFIDNKTILIRTKKAFNYFYNNLSMIPDEKSYVVINEELNQKIGVLHQGFVIQYCAPGNSFMMKGTAWTITEIEDEKIKVVRAKNEEGAVPSWEGELIPVSKTIAQTVGILRKKTNAFKKLKQEVIPDNKTLLFENFKNIGVLHSCFGSKINTTLANILSAMISAKIGANIGLKISPYKIIFSLPEGESAEIINEVLIQLKPEWIETIISKYLKNSSVYLFRFFNIAKKMGVINKYADFSKARIKKLAEIYEHTPLDEEVMKTIFKEKMDVKGTKKLINDLSSKKIKLISRTDLSPLSVMSLESDRINSFMASDKQDLEILNIIDKRLKNKQWFLVCTHCGKELGKRSYENIPEKMKCPVCESEFIGFIQPKLKEKFVKELKNEIKGKKYGKKEVENLRKTALLYHTYGKKAMYVMGAYGIGPETARRILLEFYINKKELIKRIIESERNFLRTKRFWEL